MPFANNTLNLSVALLLLSHAFNVAKAKKRRTVKATFCVYTCKNDYVEYKTRLKTKE